MTLYTLNETTQALLAIGRVEYPHSTLGLGSANQNHFAGLAMSKTE